MRQVIIPLSKITWAACVALALAAPSLTIVARGLAADGSGQPASQSSRHVSDDDGPDHAQFAAAADASDDDSQSSSHHQPHGALIGPDILLAAPANDGVVAAAHLPMRRDGTLVAQRLRLQI